MSKMSFWEKLDILFDLSKSSYLYILIIFFLLSLGIIFTTTNKKTIDRNKKIYLGFTIFTFTCMFLIFHKSLSKIFDYMMNNLFIAIYFPNLAIYLAAIIITNIIVWLSIFNFKTSDAIRKLNAIIYLLINYLLALVLSVIHKNNLDVFAQESIYTNKQATAIIELSSIIFIIWILFLIIYKIILVYLKKDYKPKMKKVVVKKEVKKLPENYKEKEIPNYIYGKAPKRDNQIVILENEKESTKTYEDLFTLEDYKILLKMLLEKKYTKEEMKEEKHLKTDILMKEENDYREQQKKEIIRLEEERKESLRREKERLKKVKNDLEDQRLEENITELERLYKGIR